MRKVLAALFFPQALLFPRDKYPELWYKRNGSGDWSFKNKEAFLHLRVVKWWREYWGFVGGTALIVCFVGGVPFLAVNAERIDQLCIAEYRHPASGEFTSNFFEATFTYGFGNQTTYRRLENETDWVSKELKGPTHVEYDKLNRFYPAYRSWGPTQCVEF